MAKKQVIWIPEVEAAAMLLYKPKTLREYAKNGKLPIDFTAPNRRKYQYNKLDIEKYLLANSTITT